MVPRPQSTPVVLPPPSPSPRGEGEDSSLSFHMDCIILNKDVPQKHSHYEGIPPKCHYEGDVMDTNLKLHFSQIHRLQMYYECFKPRVYNLFVVNISSIHIFRIYFSKISLHVIFILNNVIDFTIEESSLPLKRTFYQYQLPIT